MSEDHNQHAGQGPVMLDIGGDVGAVIVLAPASLAGGQATQADHLPTATYNRRCRSNTSTGSSPLARTNAFVADQVRTYASRSASVHSSVMSNAGGGSSAKGNSTVR